MFNSLLENFVSDEEGTPAAVGLDEAIVGEGDEPGDEMFQMMLQASQGVNVVTPTDQTPMEIELAAYRAEQLIRGHVDVLNYWKVNEKRFPLMAQVDNGL